MSEGGEAQTNAYVQVRTHEACRKTRSWIRTAREKCKDFYLAGVSIEGPQSLSQRSTGREESNRDSQLDRNTMRETRRVKREVTITAGGNYHSNEQQSDTFFDVSDDTFIFRCFYD